MKTDKKRRGSVFSMFLCNYILFTITLVLGITLLIIIGATRLNVIIEDTSSDPDGIAEYSQELARGQYDELPADRLFGGDGYFEVLDDAGKPVFQSNRDIEIEQFAPEELICIPKLGQINGVDIQNITGENGNPVKVVTITHYTADYEVEKEICLVMDEQLNILFTTAEQLKVKKLTERQYNLLTDNWNSGYSVRKMNFQTKDGQTYVLLSYSLPVADEDVFRTIQTIREVFGEMLALYIVLIILFILWLNRKISSPLHLLNRAILDFSEGKRQQYLQYKGPKEFVEICDSFNHMAQEMYATEQEKGRLEQEKQKMLADISHDLKTPITVIKGYSKAVCDGLVSEEEKQQYLSTIYQKADRLTELINTFHEYSMLEHPDYSLQPKILDICTYLRDYLAEKYNELYLAGYSLEVDIPEKSIFCNVDPAELKRVFENIITNATKHNEPGTNVFCSLEESEGHVRILLADDGAGIPAELTGTIFEPFVVGEKSRTKHGSGLGLAVSRRIVEAHGGQIRLAVLSEGTYETKFEILLPALHKPEGA